MMAKLGKEQKEIASENFAPAYETTEALVYQALIKVLATGDGMDGELTPATFEDMRREKFKQLQSATPAVEETVAEVVEEAPTAEEPVAEAVEETPVEDVAAIVEDEATMASESFVVDGKLIYVRYDRSFRARLIQSDDEIKERYSVLKNLLLSYGAKARTSWTNETFRFGRNTVAKFGIKGKTLSLYIALAPAEYEETKYSFEDVGDVKRYADVPMRLKLRSARSVKWAAELIADMMAKLGKEQKEIASENFAPAYETTEALVYQALIKVLATGDGMDGELTPATFEDMRREKFRQLQTEAPAEEAPAEEIVEEAPAEEAPAEEIVEEAPAAEVTPINETFQQATGIAIQESVDVSEAESILDDALAASFIEIEMDEDDEEEDVEEIEVINEDEEDEAEEVASAASAEEAPAEEAAAQAPVTTPTLAESAKKPAKREFRKTNSGSKKGTKEIVNIEDISRAFAAGDKVTLDALKEKKLVTRRASAVKVLARGKLDKPLTVTADEFSIQAVKMILLTGGRAVKRSKK